MSDAYTVRLEALRSFLTTHNQAIGKDGDKPNLGWIDPDSFIACLKACGGTSVESLGQMRQEDFAPCVPEVHGVKPAFIIKKIAQILRGNTPEAVAAREVTDTVVAPVKKVAQMTPTELVEAFDPEEPDTKVGERLKSMSRGEPFIVFKTGRQLDAGSTLTLLMEVKAGHKGREQYATVTGTKKVYRIGQLPDDYVDENPLYPGQALRPDGTCDVSGAVWSNVHHSTRQLLRLALQSGELKFNDAYRVHDIVILAGGDGSLKWTDGKPAGQARLHQMFPKASAKFGELEQLGELPRLKVKLSRDPQTGNVLRGGKPVPTTLMPNGTVVSASRPYPPGHMRELLGGGTEKWIGGKRIG